MYLHPKRSGARVQKASQFVSRDLKPLPRSVLIRTKFLMLGWTKPGYSVPFMAYRWNIAHFIHYPELFKKAFRTRVNGFSRLQIRVVDSDKQDRSEACQCRRDCRRGTCWARSDNHNIGRGDG
jgi:hypothetical protein